MKYCTKCGYKLVDDAKFCNSCGTPVAEPFNTQANPDNPYMGTAETQANYYETPQTFYTEEKTQEELRAEEQSCLDKISLGLKHESICWRVVGIFFIIYSVIMTLAAFGSNDGAAALNIVSAMVYLPIGIINLVMAGKVSSYSKSLYIDCQNGVGHYSIGSIIFCAFFNTIAMIFNIINFVYVKNNKAAFERIKETQNAYNSQQQNK